MLFRERIVVVFFTPRTLQSVEVPPIVTVRWVWRAGGRASVHAKFIPQPRIRYRTDCPIRATVIQ